MSLRGKHERPVLVCKAPYINSGGNAFGCGQCMPCRIRKSSEWTNRIILEMGLHAENTFVTLTYAPEYLPVCRGAPGGTLDPAHLKNYLKRLRKACEPVRFRFFAVGEYGDKTQRAHYHLILFGLPPCSEIVNAWGMGHVDLKLADEGVASYVSQYVCKKWTNGASKQVREWLGERFPEFTRMSLKPGIGAGVAPAIAESLYTYGGSKLLAETGDVPSSLHFSGRTRSIGRYIKGKVRELMDIPSGGEKFLAEQKEKLSFMFPYPYYHTPFARLYTSHELERLYKHEADVKEHLRRLYNRNRPL